MPRLTRVLLLSVIVLAGVAALVVPRLDEGPVVLCETGDDAIVTCASDENGRILADSLTVAAMLASVLLVMRTGRDHEADDDADDDVDPESGADASAREAAPADRSG